MGGGKLGFDAFDAAIVHVRAALGNDPPGVALAFGQAGFAQGVDDRQPGAGEPVAGQFLAGHVGEDAGQLGVAQFADLRAEEDLRRPLGGVQALVAVDQAGQFGGQPALGRAPAGIGLMLGQKRLDFRLLADR